MALYMRHSVLTAPPAGAPGLAAPPPGAGLLPGITRTAYTGPDNINTAGTIIRDKNITTGGLIVRASDVQIINCSFISGANSFDFIVETSVGALVDHCFFDGTGKRGLTGIGAWGNCTVTNCELIKVENGIMFGGDNVLMQGNYIYGLGYADWAHSTAYSVGAGAYDTVTDLFFACVVAHTSASAGTFAADRAAHPTYWTSSDPHVDGIQTQNCSNARIIGNWIESWDTSDIILKADGGPVNTVLVEGNTLIADPLHPPGVSYAVYSYSVGSSLCTNVTIRNNRVQIGAYGAYFATNNSTPVYSGNVDYFTGAPI
jgi:hypothetical protein